MPISEVKHGDCMDFMRELPDNFADLAIVDPPYGIGASNTKFINGTSKTYKNYFRETCWDTQTPTAEYFNELRRVSKNQIIWGGNYFADKVPVSRGWFVWDKTIHGNSYADCELAWTSFDVSIRYFRENIVQTTIEGRIHPTQKSVQIYKNILKNYAKEGDTIFDSHAGSMSSVIACIDGGFPIVACELDFDYYEAGKKRVMNHVAQLDCFIERPEIVWHNDTHIK